MNPEMDTIELEDWEFQCYRYHGRTLEGNYCHYCPDWDFLPVDDSVAEFNGCTCLKEPKEAEDEGFS
jgi:hypothetical protein